MITEILALIVSYLGIFCGIGLKKIAKNEVIAGKKNLMLLQLILFAIIIVLFFYFVQLSILYKVIAALVLMLLIYLTKNNYAVLGVIFGFEPSLLMSIFILLYGFPTGSLMKENYLQTLKKTWIYLLLGLVFLIIKTYVLA